MNPTNMIMSEKQKSVRSRIIYTKECILEALSEKTEKKLIEVLYDFEKAFDIVSHKILKKIMEAYKFPQSQKKIDIIYLGQLYD